MLIRFWRRSKPDEESFDSDPHHSDDPELREIFIRSSLRVAVAFALIFGFVFFAFWWSGSAVRFGAGRASDRVQPTWKVAGTVRNRDTKAPIPWAVVEDDPEGKPPYYHTDASYSGSFELLTLAEPHHIRVSAPGYSPAVIAIGRAWFLWLPRGQERCEVSLRPL